MDKIYLRFVRLLNPVLSKAGVDTDQLYEILRIKLMIDQRRPRTMFAQRQNNKKKVRSPWLVSFFTVLMGVFFGLTLFLNAMPYVAQTIYFSVFMVLMSLTLISDFTTVLIDTRDQFIILPRPVNDRTIAVSRILHISIYVLRLALLQGLPGLVMIGFIDGIAAVPIFFIQILEVTFMSIFLVNIVYLVLMKFVSPQKFKDIINYIQIAFSILIFGSYYLLPRLINVTLLEHISILSHWYSYILPPVWIAAFNELLFHHERANMITSLLAITGLVVPLIGLWLVAKVLAPGFNRRLSIIATSDGSAGTPAIVKTERKSGLMDKVADLVAPDPVENAGFRITWKLATRSREFKMKVYPAFGYIPIYFLYFTLNGKGQSLAERWENLKAGHNYIVLAYLCTFLLMAALSNVAMSDKYKSAVYYTTPIGEPGKILSGMYKAILVIFYIPYCLFWGAIIVGIWGPAAINDVLLAMLIGIIYGILMALFMIKGLPFSKPVLIKQSGGRVFTTLMTMIFLVGIGVGHYFLMRWETVIWIAIIPIFFIVWIMLYYYKKTTWEGLEMADDL